MLETRSEYFRGLILSVMQGGKVEGWWGSGNRAGVSAGALRVVMWYLFTAELPESGDGLTGAGGGKGAGGDGEDATEGQVLERAVLNAADLFRLERLLEHCSQQPAHSGGIYL